MIVKAIIGGIVSLKYLVGIDGGGSKTRFQRYDISGALIGEVLSGTTDYHQIGVGGVIRAFGEAFDELGMLDINSGGGGGGSVSIGSGADVQHDALIGFGMPAYGENTIDDARAVAEIKAAFPGACIHVENDVYCAWAGAMAFSAGIAVVCGTGSMAVGSDKTGKLVRSGGWNEFFSDEGSGYWLGKKALEIFAKQSDCRLPKGALHRLVKEYFKLQRDIDIINIITSEYVNSRKNTASLQMILFEAYKQGDKTALEAYKQALDEIVLVVLGAVRQLDFDFASGETIDISYIGGLFNETELFLNPFIHKLNQHFKANVFTPKLSPCHGALLFALDKYEKEKFETIRSNFLSKNIIK